MTWCRRGRGAGGRRINEAEAEVVRRIFQLFAAGESPRAIARQLNAEGVPGPGRAAVAGHHDPRPGRARHRHPQQRALRRAAGLEPLQLRQGPAHRQAGGAAEPARAVGAACRCRSCASSTTRCGRRSRRGRARSASPWPGTTRGNALNRAHRRKFLLTGLLECGVCGGGYTIMGKDRYGCAGHRNKGTCGNDRTIAARRSRGGCWTGSSTAAGARAVRGVRPRLPGGVQPPAARRWRSGPGSRRRLAAGRAQDRGMIRAIEDGLYQPSMKERMAELEAEKARLVTELAVSRTPTPIACTRTCRSSTGARWRSWRRCWPTRSSAEAMDAIRALITRIVLTPRAEGGDGRDAARRSGPDPGDLRRRRTRRRPPGDGGRSGVFREVKCRWLRGQDLNLRPSGYEPDELPGCSTPRAIVEGAAAARCWLVRAAVVAVAMRWGLVGMVGWTWRRPTLPRLETQYHGR